MCDNVKNNPFAGLFSTIDDAVSFSSQSQMIINENDEANYIKDLKDKDVRDIEEPANHQVSENCKIDSEVNRLLGDVFGITLHTAEANDRSSKA